MHWAECWWWKTSQEGSHWPVEVWFAEFAESPPVAAMFLVQGEEVVELMHYRAGSMAPHSIKVARLQVTRWL